MTYQLPEFKLQLVKEGTNNVKKALIKPEDVAELLNDVAMSDREQVVALFLNVKNRPIGRQVISIGTLNSSLVYPRELFKGACISNAFAIILVHNHPSGDPTPSNDDDHITHTIAKAGELMGIKLLDHVILSPTGRLYSYETQRPSLLRV